MDPRTLMPFGRRALAGGDDPFAAMRREMDRLFDEMGRGGWAGHGAGATVLAPRVDVKETEQAIEVHAELPGVAEKDVELRLADGVLTLRGEKRQEREEQDKGFYLAERSYGTFLRQIPLPVEIEADKVEARFDKGVLSVVLPKAAPAAGRARRIEIKPAA